MYLKLAFRNMKRSARDYLVYLLTMTLVSALMYTFNGLLFQNELRQYWNTEDMMEVMVCLATVFIMLVTAWLIAYMVRFMMEKRSTEFGIYLLLGMKKKRHDKIVPAGKHSARRHLPAVGHVLRHFSAAGSDGSPVFHAGNDIPSPCRLPPGHHLHDRIQLRRMLPALPVPLPPEI